MVMEDRQFLIVYRWNTQHH